MRGGDGGYDAGGVRATAAKFGDGAFGKEADGHDDDDDDDVVACEQALIATMCALSGGDAQEVRNQKTPRLPLSIAEFQSEEKESASFRFFSRLHCFRTCFPFFFLSQARNSTRFQTIRKDDRRPRDGAQARRVHRRREGRRGRRRQRRGLAR